MATQFGILRDGSTITLVGEHRVDIDDDLIPELRPLFQKIEARTGIEIDAYGAAAFEGEVLNAVVTELQAAQATANEMSHARREFLLQLLRIARLAQSSGKPLSYFGQ